VPFIRQYVSALSRPRIADRRQLTTYVVVTTATCVIVALSFDVANQLIFFESWSSALRSWAFTVLVSLFISAPISSLIGRAHLDLHRAKRIAEKLSRTDPLTELPNRRAIFEATGRMKGSAMILVILDIDRFKRVNDTQGHLAGDAVIVRFAATLSAAVGSLGEIGRIGGEEFMLVAPPHNVDAIVRALARFRTRLAAEENIFQGQRIRVTFSAGAAVSESPDDVDAVYREADQALYMAKSLGRNRIVYAPSFERLRLGSASRDEAMWRADADDDVPADFTSVA
jgi:diguanylate cyclase (GGDEF)-like protein